MLRLLPLLLSTVGMIEHAAACTCVSAKATTAVTEMEDAALVFRGTVLDVKPLPAHADPNVRQRYAITFRVNRFWKGDARPTVIMYV